MTSAGRQRTVSVREFAILGAMAVNCLGAANAHALQWRSGVIESIPLDAEYGRVSWVGAAGKGRILAVLDPSGADGRVVVADRGGPARQIGRNGGGPGEYGQLDAVVVQADSVYVYDRLRRRITQLSLVSGGGSTRTAAVVPRDARCTWFLEVESAALCRVLVQDPRTRVALASHYYIVRRDPAGNMKETPLVSVEFSPRGTLVTGAGQVTLTRWFSWEQRFAVSPDGHTVAVVRQSQRGRHARVVVELHDLTSGAMHSWEVSRQTREPTKADRRRMVAKEVTTLREGLSLGNPGVAAALSATVVERAMDLPDAFPPFTHIHVSDGGCVWLKDAASGIAEGPLSRYELFDRNGRSKGVGDWHERLALQGVDCQQAFALAYGHPDGPRIVRVAFP